MKFDYFFIKIYKNKFILFNYLNLILFYFNINICTRHDQFTPDTIRSMDNGEVIKIAEVDALSSGKTDGSRVDIGVCMTSTKGC